MADDAAGLPGTALPQITDWDDAYANAAHIPDADRFITQWQHDSLEWRQAVGERLQASVPYGQHPRERLDIYWPDGDVRGVAVFVHGGYWMRFNQQDFSHLARGAVERGFVTVLPGYPLCPEMSIGQIAGCIQRAVTLAASLAPGPMHLAGHSAGGHLVTHLVSAATERPGEPSNSPHNKPLNNPHENTPKDPRGDVAIDRSATFATRLGRVLSISGVHDLHPLLKTAMNDTLGLTAADAQHHSPALREPFAGVDVGAWVGADERPEFLRQTALLARHWTRSDVSVCTHEVPGQHHFNIIEALTQADSAMLDWWLAQVVMPRASCRRG